MGKLNPTFFVGKTSGHTVLLYARDYFGAFIENGIVLLVSNNNNNKHLQGDLFKLHRRGFSSKFNLSIFQKLCCMVWRKCFFPASNVLIFNFFFSGD